MNRTRAITDFIRESWMEYETMVSRFVPQWVVSAYRDRKGWFWAVLVGVVILGVTMAYIGYNWLVR